MTYAWRCRRYRRAETDTEERPVPLAVQRRKAILAALRSAGARRVLDLGCGQGQLVGELLKDRTFTDVVGVDVSMRALNEAARRLRLDRLPARQAARVKLVQGALTYTDTRLAGYDAAVLSEVVEHVDLPRLPALEHAVFGSAHPATVVVTTPNVEYNVKWESLPAGPGPPPRSPLRMEPERIPILGEERGARSRIRRRVRARRPGRSRVGAAHPTGVVPRHPSRRH